MRACAIRLFLEKLEKIEKVFLFLFYLISLASAKASDHIIALYLLVVHFSERWLAMGGCQQHNISHSIRVFYFSPPSTHTATATATNRS
jgi:hypothetical protein